MGVCVPEEHGGAGADFIAYVLVLEELSRADAGVGVTGAVHTSAATLPIVAFGTDEQRERFVPPLARGEALGAFALTEPGSGSGAGTLRATPVPRGGAARRPARPLPRRGPPPRTRGRCGRPPSRTATAGGSAARSSGARTA